MDRAQQRIAWTLGVSALLHVWFIYTAQQPGAPRTTQSAGVPLTATLSQPQMDSDRLTPTAPERVVANAAAAATSDKHSDTFSDYREHRQRAPAGEPTVAVHLAHQAAAADRAEVVSLTPPRSASRDDVADATYYTARDLDVFPKAITVLELALRAGAPGKVRATVLIDESGKVNEVRAIDTGVAEIERAARDLLLRARFTPASKDGRLVKAQLLVSLEYSQSP